MSQVEWVKIRCGNATCRAWTMKIGEAHLEAHLRSIGWALEEIDGEVAPVCARCRS